MLRDTQWVVGESREDARGRRTEVGGGRREVRGTLTVSNSILTVPRSILTVSRSILTVSRSILYGFPFDPCGFLSDPLVSRPILIPLISIPKQLILTKTASLDSAPKVGRSA